MGNMESGGGQAYVDGASSTARSSAALHELISTLRQMETRIGALEATSGTAIDALSKRLDGIDAALKQLSVSTTATRAELSGGLDAIGSKIRAFQDEKTRAAQAQRALLSGALAATAEEAPATKSSVPASPPRTSAEPVLVAALPSVRTAACAPPLATNGTVPTLAAPIPGPSHMRRKRDGRA